MFKTRQKLYKPLVMQFRFTNVLVIFQRRINSVLGEHLDEFIIVYFSNIIIYLSSKKEHKNILNRVYNNSIIKRY